MNIPKKLLRALPTKVKGTKPIKYDITAKGDKYRIIFNFSVPKGAYTGVLKVLAKMYDKKITLLDHFQAPPELKEKIAKDNRLIKLVRSVEKTTRKDEPTFKILNYNVEDIAFTEAGDMIETELIVFGLCYA